MSFKEQLEIAIDTISNNQRRIFELGKFSIKIINFTIVDTDGWGTDHTCVEGMTFRALAESPLSCGQFEIEDDLVIHNGRALDDTSADDKVVEDGIYQELDSFVIDGKRYLGAGIGLTFGNWVNTPYNRDGFYFDGNKLRTADGKYICAADPYNLSWYSIIQKTTDVEPSVDGGYEYLTFYDYIVIVKDGYDSDIGVGENEKPSLWSDILPLYWEDVDITQGNTVSDPIVAYCWGISFDGNRPLLYNGVAVKGNDAIISGGRYVIEGEEEG